MRSPSMGTPPTELAQILLRDLGRTAGIRYALRIASMHGEHAAAYQHAAEILEHPATTRPAR
jgi:hypothetical protein